MATFYIQARKLGPVVTYQVVANSRAQAIANLVASEGPGEEFQVLGADTTLATTGVTGGTGPSGATGAGL